MAPATVPGRSAVTFPANLTTSFDWNLLGWLPDGKVRGQYAVTADSSGPVPQFDAFGNTDVDGDGVLAEGKATQARKPWLDTSNNVY